MEPQESPRPIGRRARNRAARAAFKAARDHGLVARRRAKLRHLAERQQQEPTTDVAKQEGQQT